MGDISDFQELKRENEVLKIQLKKLEEDFWSLDCSYRSQIERDQHKIQKLVTQVTELQALKKSVAQHFFTERSTKGWLSSMEGDSVEQPHSELDPHITKQCGQEDPSPAFLRIMASE